MQTAVVLQTFRGNVLPSSLDPTWGRRQQVPRKWWLIFTSIQSVKKRNTLIFKVTLTAYAMPYPEDSNVHSHIYHVARYHISGDNNSIVSFTGLHGWTTQKTVTFHVTFTGLHGVVHRRHYPLPSPQFALQVSLHRVKIPSFELRYKFSKSKKI